jgi:hypothetical protein
MSRIVSRSLLGFIVVLAAAGMTSAQQCHNCDCYHPPVSDSCIKCCKVVTGIISAVSGNTVTVQESTSAGQKEETIVLTPDTKRNAEVKKGAAATVYFRGYDKVATQISVLDKLKGLLVPGNEIDPPTPCTLPNTALKVYLGSTVSWTNNDQANDLVMRSEDVLSVRRVSNGLAVFAKVASADGRVVAEIVDNRFYINPNNFLRTDQPDSHSLVVYDQKGNKVLDIKYLNPRSVRILGEFRAPGAVPLFITSDQLRIGRGIQENRCFEGAITIF